MEEGRPEYLSAEELRNRMFHSLRERGMLDSIKSQLRNNIVKELQRHAEGSISSRSSPAGGAEGSLLHRATNSLVADHLRRCQYEYSLSVFLPESGISQEKVLPTADLLQLLGISIQSRLYKKLAAGHTKDGNTRRGFLWQLLSEISSLHSNPVMESGVQTDLIRVEPITSLNEKLDSVDSMYNSKRDENLRHGATAMEDRLMSFQRQLEERYRSDLQLELARIRENDIARIRVEEKEQSRRELDQQRRELERIYQSKSDGLQQRERNSIERMQREQELAEKEIYTQRQTVLIEIEQIRQRELDLKRQEEMNEREKRLQDDRAKAKEDELRKRELAVKRLEGEFEQKLNNQMTTFKVEQQAKLMERTQNLEIRESRLKDEERRVYEEKEHLQSLKDQLKDKSLRISELENQIQEDKHKEFSVSRQNEYLNSKLRDMADYKVLQEQNAVMKNELETLRTRLAELLSMNERERGRQEELMRELRRPTPETLMLQRDLEKARESLRQEQTVGGTHRQQLEQRLQEEMDRNRELLRRMEEMTLQSKEMNRELVDLRSQLSYTHQALTNEVHRKPAADNKDVEEQHLRSQRFAEMTQEREISMRSVARTSPAKSSRRDVENNVYHDIDMDIGIPGLASFTNLSDDDGSVVSADIVAETKYRLKNLEKEASNLESAYRNFQYHMTNVGGTSLVQADDSNRNRGKRSTQDEQEKVIPPSESPIHRPMSSTPYQQARANSNFHDSLHELTGPSSSRDRPPPQFDLSNMSDEDHQTDERIEKPRPITVADLEARPGSPSIVIVPGSAPGSASSVDDPASSKGKVSEKKDHQLPSISKPGSLPPLNQESLTVTPSLPVHGAKLAPISLDDAWKTPSAQEKEMEETRRKEEERNQREALEKEQEELKRLEREEAERRKQEEEAERKEPASDDGIDPTMKQYMEMIQKKKEEEKALATKVADSWSKGRSTKHDTPTHSEQELSVAEDVNSENLSSDDNW